MRAQAVIQIGSLFADDLSFSPPMHRLSSGLAQYGLQLDSAIHTIPVKCWGHARTHPGYSCAIQMPPVCTHTKKNISTRFTVFVCKIPATGAVHAGLPGLSRFQRGCEESGANCGLGWAVQIANRQTAKVGAEAHVGKGDVQALLSDATLPVAFFSFHHVELNSPSICGGPGGACLIV